MEFVIQEINEGRLSSCHDISNGGMLLALFEMTLSARNQGGDIGIEVDLGDLCSDLSPDKLLFSETGGFLCEVGPDNEEAFLKTAKNGSVEVIKIGGTSKSPSLIIQKSDTLLVDLKLTKIADIWTFGLKQALNP